MASSDSSVEQMQQSQGVTKAKACVHKTKTIQFFGRKSPVILQNENGPCPLLAICNVLLLRNNLNLTPDVTEVPQEKLLSLVAERLIDSNCNINNKNMSYVENQQQNIADAIDLLPCLTTGIDVNIKFRRIDDFEFTRECTIFDLLDIPLYHGWIVDPEDRDTVDAIGSKSYNSLTGELVALETLTQESNRSPLQDVLNFPPSTSTSSHDPLFFLSQGGSPFDSTCHDNNGRKARKGDLEEEAQLLKAMRLSATELPSPIEDPPSKDPPEETDSKSNNDCRPVPAESEGPGHCQSAGSVSEDDKNGLSRDKEDLRGGYNLHVQSTAGEVEDASHYGIRAEDLDFLAKCSNARSREGGECGICDPIGEGKEMIESVPCSESVLRNDPGPLPEDGGGILENTDNVLSTTREITPHQGELIKNFLRTHASQLTLYGLFCLQEGIKERELCVFFRNNHFNTLFKYNGELYILATDQGYINQQDLVWEKLNAVNGDTLFVTGNFTNFNAESPTKNTWDDNNTIANTTDYLSNMDRVPQMSSDPNSDLQLAIALQQQEFEHQPLTFSHPSTRINNNRPLTGHEIEGKVRKDTSSSAPRPVTKSRERCTIM